MGPHKHNYFLFIYVSLYLFINVLLVPQFAFAAQYFEMKNGASFLRLVRSGALAWN